MQKPLYSVNSLSRRCACLLLAAAAVLTGCRPNPAARSEANRPKPAVPVVTADATRKDVPLQLRAIGTVRPYASVSVKARVDGQIARIAFVQGGEVTQGDLIVQIDPRPFEAARDQAAAMLARDQASLENAEIDMRRTDELAGTKAVPASLVDSNRAKVATLRATAEADKAALELARLQLSFCSVCAPMTGRVGLRLVDEGAMVRNNETVLVVINQVRPVYVDFAVPEQALPEIRRAAAAGRLPVELVAPGSDASALEGELEVVNNEVDTTTGTALLRAKCANEKETLWPGQFVNVTLQIGAVRGATVVPSQAVQLSQSGEFVFVVNADGTADKRTVAPGPQWSGYTVITAGVAPGETVVIDGQMRLVPGARVHPVTAAQPQPKPPSPSASAAAISGPDSVRANPASARPPSDPVRLEEAGATSSTSSPAR